MYSKRLVEAFELAASLHQNQKRKGKDIPYLSHLMGVASLVLEHGGNEDEVIAALLHDSLEDQPDKISEKEIKDEFGERVAFLVKGCTLPKLNWKLIPKDQIASTIKAMREKQLEELRHLDERVRFIKACDTLHNISTLAVDVKLSGIKSLERFRGGIDGTIWHFETRAGVFEDVGPREIGKQIMNHVYDLHTERLRSKE